MHQPGWIQEVAVKMKTKSKAGEYKWIPPGYRYVLFFSKF